MNMAIVSLIYCSALSDDIQEQDIATILDSCHSNNPDHDITGLLCFSNQFFIQYIEGEAKEVNKLYHMIAQDVRHKDCVILDYAYINKRRFSHWDMGYIGEQHFEKAHQVLFNYGFKNDFNPYELQGAAAFDFLVDLSSSLTLK
jgi:hypothetical protein